MSLAVDPVGEQLAHAAGVLAGAGRPLEPRLELDREVEAAHVLDSSPASAKNPRHSSSRVVADVRRVADPLGLLDRLAHVEVVDDDHAVAGDARELGDRSGDVGEMVRRDARSTARSKLESANGRSSAKQMTSGCIPGDGSQLTTSSPASRSRRAT